MSKNNHSLFSKLLLRSMLRSLCGQQLQLFEKNYSEDYWKQCEEVKFRQGINPQNDWTNQ